MGILYFFKLVFSEAKIFIFVCWKIMKLYFTKSFCSQNIEKESGVRIQTISYSVECMEVRKTAWVFGRNNTLDDKMGSLHYPELTY